MHEYAPFCLSVDGRLGRSYLLALVNSAVVNIGAQTYVCVLTVLLGVNPDVELLDQMVVLFLNF